MSSPVAYPATSSPREVDSPRKRRRLQPDDHREPLKSISHNAKHPESQASIGGFLDEDDSEDESPLLRKIQESRAPTLSEPIPTIDDIGNEVHKQYDLEHVVELSHDSGCETLSSSLGEHDKPASQESSQLSPAKPLIAARTSSGRRLHLAQRRKARNVNYSEIVAARSITAPGRAKKDYYGIGIHALLDQSNALLEVPETTPREAPVPSIEPAFSKETSNTSPSSRILLWTEKYRARKFTDLIGDERTHRSVLRWLKSWDPIVFPSQHASRSKPRNVFTRPNEGQNNERPHRKVLLLTGPPGLGKTTLAHVCARQAGYETQEINASDERTKDVVKNRIKDMVGTENVRSVNTGSSSRSSNAAKPVCVVVDEVDGVVTGTSANAGSGGGEGGFIKALTELLALDQKNASHQASQNVRHKKKGDNFRMLRPLVLVCNDVYHPSLRLLRHGTAAEIIHVRKPALQMVVPRLCSIFEKEGVPADSDGVRTLCEAAWGVTSRKQGGKADSRGTNDGDIRGILVAGEWVATKLRMAAFVGSGSCERLTRRWIEQNTLSELAHGGGMARNLGRGGVKDIVERIFKHNAGFSNTAPFATAVTGQKRSRDDLYGREAAIGVSEVAKKNAIARLQEMVEASGEEEKILLDCFASYPNHPYQDTTHLTKPDIASEWLHFSCLCSHRLHHNQEWDLAPYQAYPVLAFHNLFASSNNALISNINHSSTEESEQKHPLHTPRADAASFEFHRANTAHLTYLHSQLSPPLQRSFRSHSNLATELIPYALRCLNPAVKPVLVGGVSSVRRAEERALVDRSVECMRAVGVKFEKGRVDHADGENAGATGYGMQLNGGWVYRLEPPIDELGTYGTYEAKAWDGDAGKARYALRQVLAQTYDAAVKRAEHEGRARRGGGPVVGDGEVDKERSEKSKEAEDAKKARRAVKRDFFGRPITAVTAEGIAVARDGRPGSAGGKAASAKPRIWATFNEGYSNAVRKPITMKELMEGL